MAENEEFVESDAKNVIILMSYVTCTCTQDFLRGIRLGRCPKSRHVRSKENQLEADVRSCGKLDRIFKTSAISTEVIIVMVRSELQLPLRKLLAFKRLALDR